ncbi:MAG: UDP-N-acetylmuramoyl-L-alanine--D-glutamate ligase [Alphaproteobacteria bacterium]
MIPLTHLKGQKIAVLGLSRTGQATALAALAGGAQVDVWDDNPDNPTPEGATRLNFPEQGFSGHDALVMSPGIPLTHPKPHNAVLLAKAASIPVIGDIELLWRERQSQNPFIGITGTNGKSTTTALLGHILHQAEVPAAVGGNIGDAVLALDAPPQGAPFVLEISSYQLDLCRSTEFAAAALLNITPDHLARHGGLSGYIDAKLRIFARQKAGNLALIGVDDEHGKTIAAALSHHSRASVLSVTTAKPLEYGISAYGGDLRLNGHHILDLRTVPRMAGEHNWQNAAIAAGLAWHSGLTADQIADGIRTFPGLAHRQELIGTKDGISFVNDSKATNAEAAAVALRAYKNVFWLAGGQSKEGGLQAAMHDLSDVKAAFLYGECAPIFADQLAAKPFSTQVFSTLEEAFGTALATAKAESIDSATILLAPAAASWDQFISFEARGDVFRALADAYLN